MAIIKIESFTSLQSVKSTGVYDVNQSQLKTYLVNYIVYTWHLELSTYCCSSLFYVGVEEDESSVAVTGSFLFLFITAQGTSLARHKLYVEIETESSVSLCRNRNGKKLRINTAEAFIRFYFYTKILSFLFLFLRKACVSVIKINTKASSNCNRAFVFFYKLQLCLFEAFSPLHMHFSLVSVL